MTNYASLFSRFILRAMFREKIRTAIVVLGIALGVAVMIAIRLANRSVNESFRAAVGSIGGGSSLVVRGAGGRFDERLLADCQWLREFGRVSPAIETYVMVTRDPTRNDSQRGTEGETLRVLGVDVLEDAPIRDYRLLKLRQDDREPTPQEFLRILIEPDSIVLTEKFARRAGRTIGDTIVLTFGSARHELTIRGLLLDEGPAQALDGNFALMDIAAAQWRASELGFLDRVDIQLTDGKNLEVARAEIARRLPPGLVVESPERSAGRSETMIAAFQFNLQALGGIALLVGLMLIYNSMAVSVAARRAEIGMLQAVGASGRMVLALFLGEAALVGAVGATGGLALGGFLAHWAVNATADTVETFYLPQVAPETTKSLALGREEIILGIAAAIGLSLLAAALPAIQAARIQPMEVIAAARQPIRGARLSRRTLGLAIVLILLGILATRLSPVAGRPVFGFLAQFLLTMGGVCFVPVIVSSVCRVISYYVAPIIPSWQTIAQLATANLSSAVSRIAISIAALAVSLAMMTAIAVMVGSFRETVVYWLKSTLHADLFVRPVSLTSTLMETRMDRDVMETILRDPDVAATGWFLSRQAVLGDRAIRIATSDLANLINRSVLLFKEPADGAKAARAAIGGDQVLVSESFALRFGKRSGETVAVPTSSGPQEFRIAAIYYDYASNEGTIMMDGPAYTRSFGEHNPGDTPASLSIDLRAGADAEVVRARLARSLGERHDLFISTNANIRAEALRVFDSTFAITYALELIAVVIAGLGVISTLITLIYQRQREIALLSLVGATPGQVRRMVVIEALVIGGVSQLLGILIGLVLAVVLIYVINVQSFAWTIQFHLPLAFLGQSTLLIVATTLICGLYPALRAANIRALEVTREE